MRYNSAKRKEQIARIMQAKTAMYGDLQAVAGVQ